MTAAIDVVDLYYAYPPLVTGGEPAPVLKGINLRIDAGEFVAIMGRTGAGKTTLCLTLNGIIPHSTGGVFQGCVRVFGLDTRMCEVATLASTVGVVLQDPESQFFNMTVEDEVAFGPESQGLPPDLIAERVEWALQVVEMLPYRRRSPFQLSGGEMQRVAIASVLAMRPRVLVLDEPTSGLDPLGKAEVFRVVRRLKEQGITIILVEQDADRIAEFADRVIVLEDGCIVADGSPQDLFTQVERMERAGVAVPQVSELAARCNRLWQVDWRFVCIKQACTALAQRLLSAPGAVLPSDIRLRTCRVHHSDKTAIRVERLWYQYNREIVALRDVSLDIPAGAFVAILGQNGSGKSTLAKHFNGLLKPTRGHVYVNGEDTARRNVGDLARVVGYVFQNPDHQIFCPTVWEEVAFGPRNLGLDAQAVQRRVEETLERFGLTAHAEKPPALLGFGLRRKVALAAVCAMRPEVLILDEPTTGLDWASALDLMALVDELHAAGHTIVMITHDMRLAVMFAEQVLVLHEGRVLLYGDTHWVFSQRDVLNKARLEPPQIAQLAACLHEQGFAIRSDVLTVDEFIAACVSVQKRKCSLGVDTAQ